MKYMNYSYLYWREKTNMLFGGIFGVAAFYHFAGIFIHVNDASVLRHALFVMIDMYCIYGFVFRPRYFNLFFSVLTIQQIYTHGSQLAMLWSLEHRIHWISLAVIILIPLGLAKLITEYFTEYR